MFQKKIRLLDLKSKKLDEIKEKLTSGELNAKTAKALKYELNTMIDREMKKLEDQERELDISEYYN